METIGEQAFFKCAWLNRIEIKNGVKKIEKLAFGCCERLQAVTLPESIEKISETAFLGCGLLTKINVPRGAKEGIGKKLPPELLLKIKEC